MLLSLQHFFLVLISYAHPIIQVARDDDLKAQIGKDIYFDLVDHDKVPSFRIQKQMTFAQFKVITSRDGVFWHIPVIRNQFACCHSRT
jgi:hypothetical protein